jgi:hypothetical protein
MVSLLTTTASTTGAAARKREHTGPTFREHLGLSRQSRRIIVDRGRCADHFELDGGGAGAGAMTGACAIGAGAGATGTGA